MSTTPPQVLVWTAVPVEGACRLTELDGFDDDFRLMQGEALAAEWPRDVRMGMDPFQPRDLMLLDSVDCLLDVLVVSGRLAAFLREQALPGIELLPVTVVNHKKRAVPEPYFLLNPVGLHDALDQAASKPRWSKIADDTIESMKSLVIDPARLPLDVPLFRLKYYTYPVLVRPALAQAIDAAGFTGIRWRAPEQLRIR